MKVFAFLILDLALAAFAFGKTFNRCSLALGMSRLGVNRNQLAPWTCIAERESFYHSGITGPTNYNYYFCCPDDISNSVRCVLTKLIALITAKTTN